VSSLQRIFALQQWSYRAKARVFRQCRYTEHAAQELGSPKGKAPAPDIGFANTDSNEQPVQRAEKRAR